MRNAAKKKAEAHIKLLISLENQGISIDGQPSYLDVFNEAMEREKKEFYETCELGIELMSGFKGMVKERIGIEGSGSRWYLITVRPPHDTRWEKFKLGVEQYVTKHSPKWIEYEYVFEQKGEDIEHLGYGFHTHMIICTNTKNYYPSHMLRDLKSQFNYVNAACIQVDTIKNLNRAREYIHGIKNNDEKLKAVEMDKVWRDKLSLPASVKSTRQEDIVVTIDN